MKQVFGKDGIDMEMRIRNRKNILTILCITLNVLILIISLIFLFMTILNIEENILKILLYINIFFQIISILINNSLSKLVDSSGLEIDRKELISMLKQNYGTLSLDRVRTEIREEINWLVYAFCIILIFFCILLKSFCLLVFSISFIFLVYMYIDYFSYVRTYARLIEEKVPNTNKPVNTRLGIARIYLEEYNNNNKNLIIKKDNNDILKEYVNGDKCQAECIKNILIMYIDYIDIHTTVLEIILLLLNILFIFPDTLDIIANELVYGVALDTNLIKIIIVVTINVVFSFVSFYSTVNYPRVTEEIKKVSDLLKGNLQDECYKLFTELRSKVNDFELIIARGIFVYNSKYFNDFNELKKIPKEYRTKFYQRVLTHIPRFYTTLCLTTVSLVSLLIFFKINYLIILVFLFVEFLIYIFIYMIYLPRIYRDQMEYWCGKL